MLARERKPSQALAERARVVLACAEESGVAPLTSVAARTWVSRESVRKWQVRFMEHRIGGLRGRAPPGSTAENQRRAGRGTVTCTLTQKGRGQDSHWSTRTMAAETGPVAVVGVTDQAALRPQTPCCWTEPCRRRLQRRAARRGPRRWLRTWARIGHRQP